MIQRTLIMLKPDAVRRGLVGEIIRRFEQKQLRILAMKMLRFTPDLVRKHYDVHVDQPYYPPLEEFTLSGPVVALVLEGDDAIAVTRAMVGRTSHLEAAPGTIRGDLANSTRENLVHGSDSPERAAVEIANFFSEAELVG